jgi:thermostable 8-oxoguanine DNA glycosylase
LHFIVIKSMFFDSNYCIAERLQADIRLASRFLRNLGIKKKTQGTIERHFTQLMKQQEE